MKAVLKDKTGIIVILLALTLFCIALISATAYSSRLQYDINNLNSQISQREWSQRNLEAQIKSANTLSSLENEALSMGLVYPTFDEIVYLEEPGSQELQDFALALRVTAYE